MQKHKGQNFGLFLKIKEHLKDIG